MNHKRQITHISITRLRLRPTIRRFILLAIHLREINPRGGIFNCSRRALRHLERPRGPGLKGTNGLCDELRLQLQKPPAETHEISNRQQNFHPTLASEADPSAIVGENNCRRHPDPVGMLKCRPESKMCVCSGCVRCIIFLAQSPS